MIRRNASNLCGILALDKKSGISSHDLVNQLRFLLGERRCGHTGTLDPAASGLMFVAVGPACRLTQYLSCKSKSYRARIVFGCSTDTDDGLGRPLSSPMPVAKVSKLLAQYDSYEVCKSLIGVQAQIPPAYSAIKKNGRRAYSAAAVGKPLKLDAREVTIYAATLEREACMPQSTDDFSAGLPFWELSLRVSKGCYIRSIARDLGKRFGCGAYLAALRRVNIGNFSIKDAHSVAELKQICATHAKLPWCDPVVLLGFPVLKLKPHQRCDVLSGRSFLLEENKLDEGLISCVFSDKLLAVYEYRDGYARAACVINKGVCGVC